MAKIDKAMEINEAHYKLWLNFVIKKLQENGGIDFNKKVFKGVQGYVDTPENRAEKFKKDD